MDVAEPGQSFPWLGDVLLCHADMSNMERNEIVLQLMRHDRIQRGTLATSSQANGVPPILSRKSQAGSVAYILLYPGRLAVVGMVKPAPVQQSTVGQDNEKLEYDLSSSEALADAARLLAQMVDEIREHTDLIQAVLHLGRAKESEVSWLRKCYAAAGLVQLANLGQFELKLNQAKQNLLDDVSMQGHGTLRMIEWREELTSRLCQIVQRTYEGTLDVPKLNGQRQVIDTLTGYLASSPASEPIWWIVERGGDDSSAQSEIVQDYQLATGDTSSSDCGCLLLTRHDEELVELVYIGVEPNSRGLGIAKRLMRFLLRWALDQKVQRIVLAVDLQNSPALRLYEEFGFERIGEAEVWYVPNSFAK